MNITPLQDSFNRGELSPRVFRRVDAEWFQDGVAVLENFIPVSRGAVKRRPGFRYLGQIGQVNALNVFPQTVSVEIATPGVDVVA